MVTMIEGSLKAERTSITAKFRVATSGSVQWSDAEVTGGDFVWISGNTITWDDLYPGSRLITHIKVKIIVTSLDPETGELVSSDVFEEGDFTFYTQPDIFSWGGKGEDGFLKGGPNGDIVNNSFFMNKWNDLCEVAGQYQAWRKQMNKYYGRYDDCKYKKDQWMSASKFNEIATAIEAKTDDNKNLEVKKDDIITAKLFNDLIKNVVKEDEV